MGKQIDISAIIPSKENIAKLLNEINGTKPLTQEEIAELTQEKRVEEAEQADRSYFLNPDCECEKEYD